MSFTEDVKNELARKHRESPKERAAELLALLRMSGSVITGAGGKWGMEFSTSNSAVAGQSGKRQAITRCDLTDMLTLRQLPTR